MNILYLYNATQTYTNTVYEHLAAFAKYATLRPHFLHVDCASTFTADLAAFDAVCIHYSIRLPFDQISPSLEAALSGFKGLKFLFIQDEYDHTWRAWHWIKRLDIRLVFTVVPDAGIERIYPHHEFPNTRFVSVLTGYLPEADALPSALRPPSQRKLLLGYRGRPLPVRYGQLGFDKIQIGEKVKAYCDAQGLATDIAWSEEARIYGPQWNVFLASCRATLGTESGSNVFDWDGTLVQRIATFRHEHPDADDAQIYENFVRQHEMQGVMNQVSPRIFEAIASRTALVLFEGWYSGVVRPHDHFIPLQRDGSNLREVTERLKDGRYLDELTTRAYEDVIRSGLYSYRRFVERVEQAITECWQSPAMAHAPLVSSSRVQASPACEGITRQPIRAQPPGIAANMAAPSLAMRLWSRTPRPIQSLLRPTLHKLFGKG